MWVGKSEREHEPNLLNHSEPAEAKENATNKNNQRGKQKKLKQDNIWAKFDGVVNLPTS